MQCWERFGMWDFGFFSFFCFLQRFHRCLKYKDEKKRGEIVTLVYPGQVLDGEFILSFFNNQRESFVHTFDCVAHAGGKAIFLENEEEEIMVDRVEGLDQVNEHDEGLEVVLFSGLEGGFEGEDGVRAGFVFEATTLSLEAIVAHMSIHAMRDDGSEDFVCAVEEADGAPVVRVGGVSLFEHGREGATGPLF